MMILPRAIAVVFLSLGFIDSSAAIHLSNRQHVEDSSETASHRRYMQGANTDDSSVYELVIGRVRDNIDNERLNNIIRPEFNRLIRSQKAVKVFRTFDVELDTSHPETSTNTAVSLFRYRSIKAYERFLRKMRSSEIAGEFSASVDTQIIILTPTDEGRPPIRSIAKKGKQVLGIAIRNTTTYEDFDTDEFLQLRENFLDGISQVKGVRRTLSWKADDLDVLFTVYTSSKVYRGLLETPEEVVPSENFEDVQSFLSTYPVTRGIFVGASEIAGE